MMRPTSTQVWIRRFVVLALLAGSGIGCGGNDSSDAADKRDTASGEVVGPVMDGAVDGPSDPVVQGPADVSQDGPTGVPLDGPTGVPLDGPTDTPLDGPTDAPLGGLMDAAVDGPRMWSVDGGRFDVVRDVPREVAGIDGGASEAGSSCAPEEWMIPAGGLCSEVVTHCDNAWDGSCWNWALSQAVSGKIWGCGGRCGEWLVGFSGGCATVLVELSRVGITGSRSYEDVMACAQSYLFSTRFDCVPADGWVQLHVDGCTLP